MLKRKLFFFFCVFSLAGCASTPPVASIPHEEQVRRDNALGISLAPQFESKVIFKKDIDVNVYFRDLGERIGATSSELRNSPVGVFLIADRTERWRNYGLPGNRVYLSTGLMKQLDFENQIAGAIAFEFANILKRHAISKVPAEYFIQTTGLPPLVESVPNPALKVDGATVGARLEYFGPAGIFSFSEEEYLASAELAIELLYKAGFDPRGLVSMFLKYQQNPSRSPFEPTLLAKLLEKTRHTIALYAPLRNPIVRSEAFLTIRKRVRGL